MTDQNHPLSPHEAPDPSYAYERAHPARSLRMCQLPIPSDNLALKSRRTQSKAH